MEGTVKQRLVFFIKQKELSQGKFEKIIGAGNGFVNNISKSIGAEKLQSILYNFPELDANWLLYGEGKMLRTEEKKEKKSTSEVQMIPISELLSRLDKKDAQIDKLIETIQSQQRTLEARDRGNVQGEDAVCADVG